MLPRAAILCSVNTEPESKINSWFYWHLSKKSDPLSLHFLQNIIGRCVSLSHRLINFLRSAKAELQINLDACFHTEINHKTLQLGSSCSKWEDAPYRTVWGRTRLSFYSINMVPAFCVCLSVCILCKKVPQPGWVWEHAVGSFAPPGFWMQSAPPLLTTLPSLCSDRMALWGTSHSRPLSPCPPRGSDAVGASRWTWTSAEHAHTKLFQLAKIHMHNQYMYVFICNSFVRHEGEVLV